LSEFLESCMPLTIVKTDPAERRGALWLDALVLFGVAALALGIGEVAAQWRHPLREAVDIDLSLKALPRYAFFTFVRGWIAYFFSLLFTLVIASWAFYDIRARRYILPALDVLQSLPVLTFLPGLEFAMVAIFPRSNTGLELACILSIFLSQVWNMTFSYYDSLRGTPADFRMLGRLYNFNWWNRFWRVELPFGGQALLYNSMVSMAGGWFFLTVCEAFSSGDKDFRVPGVGSYMFEAMARGNVRAEIAGVVAMGLIILVIDRLIWWPLVVWSRKFKLDDFGGNRPLKTRFQLWLARSAAIQMFAASGNVLKRWVLPPPQPPSAATSLLDPGKAPPPPARLGKLAYAVVIVALLAILIWGGVRLAWLIEKVRLADWIEMLKDAALSFLRVLAAVLIGTLWTVPFGIWIGLNPKLSSRLQPFIQFVASSPHDIPLAAGTRIPCARIFAVGLGAVDSLWHPVVYPVQCGRSGSRNSERYVELRGNPSSDRLATLDQISHSCRHAGSHHRLDHGRGWSMECHDCRGIRPGWIQTPRGDRLGGLYRKSEQRGKFFPARGLGATDGNRRRCHQ
jgi:NitT/TauT family transport system permease protein